MSDGNWMEDAVRDFMVAMNQPVPEQLDLKGVRMELRAKLILEEAIETVEAMGFHVDTFSNADGSTGIRLLCKRDPDWPEVVDGLCDLIYVTLGVAVEAGFRLGPFFHEVHRSNMTKVGGPVREDGKVLKPDTWEPPRIAYLWDRVLERAGLK
jgi:predicted HAD superfamily Cof-like phosphohydrolase